MYKKILLAVDGSATAEHALLETSNLADGDSQVRLLTVLDNPYYILPMPYAMPYDLDAIATAARAQARLTLEQAREKLEELAVNVEPVLIELADHQHGHSIAEAIVGEARQWQADLIVMGTHGRRGAGRLLLGSVAEQVVRSASRPVLLVRGPAQASGLLNPAEPREPARRDHLIGS